METRDVTVVERRSQFSLPTVLVVAEDVTSVPQLEGLKAVASLDIVHQATTVGAAAYLEKNRPYAVLVDLSTKVASDIFRSLRKSPNWAETPLIALTNPHSDSVFAEAIRSGADDVVRSTDVESLAVRLRAAKLAATRTPEVRGNALVAGADAEFRVMAGRVLAGAGYEVEFALDATDVWNVAAYGNVSLIVTTEDLPAGNSIAILEASRAAKREIPFVLAVSARHRARTWVRTRKLNKVALCDVAGTPDELLFAANELLFAPQKSRRTSPRASYGTRAWIRPVGGNEDIVAFTYNISRGGMFVRTLYPFASAEAVWIDVKPPYGDRRVRLSAVGTWHRPFGPLGPALSPPGTGFQITGGLPGEQKLWEEGADKVTAL